MAARRIPIVALAAVVIAGTLAGTAFADHSVFERISDGEVAGNDPFDAAPTGASDDGTHFFFEALETLAVGDKDNRVDVYDRANGVTTRVSSGQINGNLAFDATFRGASADGSRVFFTTAEKLVAGDTDSSTDLYERSGGITRRLSVGQVNGNGAFGVQFAGASDDGSRVFFQTSEQLIGPNTLVGEDADNSSDIYERSGSVTRRVSIGQINGNGAFAASFDGSSADGTRVFFRTAEQLVAADTDAVTDLYVRSDGVTTTRISTGELNGNDPLPAQFRGASSDGSRVFFTTEERLVTNDIDFRPDVYERGSTTTRVSIGTTNGNGAIDAFYRGNSSNGSHVYFETNEALLASDSDSATDVYERSGGVTRRASTGQINGNGSAFPASFNGASADGNRIFFHTDEQLVASDTDTFVDVYQRSGGGTIRLSIGQIGGNGTFHTSFRGASADGSRVFLHTDEKLTVNDSDNSGDIFERFGGATSRVSDGQIGGNGPFENTFLLSSLDGTSVFFSTGEPLESGDLDTNKDIYAARVAP